MITASGARNSFSVLESALRDLASVTQSLENIYVRKMKCLFSMNLFPEILFQQDMIEYRFLCSCLSISIKDNKKENIVCFEQRDGIIRLVWLLHIACKNISTFTHSEPDVHRKRTV